MSFFDEFNHIVPYSVSVNVGGNKPFMTHKSKRSYTNHKGKMVAFYKKANTFEELEQHGLGEYMEYMPAQEVSMPINIQVTSDKKLKTVFEKTSKYTHKEWSDHRIHLLDINESQVGFVSISLTPSGDIEHKSCFYTSPDGSEEISHSISNIFEDGNVIKNETMEFILKSNEETRKVEVLQKDGKITGYSVVEYDSKTLEEATSQLGTDFSKNRITPKLKRYIVSCVSDEPEYSKRGGYNFSWESKVLEDDLLEYEKKKYEFQEHINAIKEQTGIELSIEQAIKYGRLSHDEQEKLGIPAIYFWAFDISGLARYLADENNNRLLNFKGHYIGNILKSADNGYKACIVTKHQKDGQDYRLYTLIDLTGTNITKGTTEDVYIDPDIVRDPDYLERLKTADKTPKFVTRLNPDGTEELVLYEGKAVSGDCPEYDKFVADFIAPFSEIKSIKISKFLNKQQQYTD